MRYAVSQANRYAWARQRSRPIPLSQLCSLLVFQLHGQRKPVWCSSVNRLELLSMWIYSYSERVSLDDLRRSEVPDPMPGPQDVVLRMRAASLNYRDLAIARGHYHVAVNPPLVPLSDGAGEVVAVGSAATRVRIGDLACPVFLPNWDQ